MSEYYICIDLGTTKIKCSLITQKGNILYFSEKEAKTLYKEIIYQDPDAYLNIVLEEIKNIKSSYPKEFNKINSLIISGQMGGTLGVDENFNVVFPWTYSVDTKYNEYLFKLENEFGKKIREYSGGSPTIAAKIIWIKNKFPNKYKKVKKFINLMSYVACKLCNLSYKQAFIDCSCLTMSGVADIKNQSWNEELCKNFDIDIEKLPNIKKANEIIGNIGKNIFDIDKEIIVLAGCGDQVAGFIGAGINKKNDLIDVSGTYTILGYCNNKYIPDIEFSTLHSIYSGLSNIYYQIAIITAGGYTFDWFLNNFKYKNNLILNNELNKQKEKMYFIPHFGGRYSPSQPYFRGGWIGITWEHNIYDFYIAMLESLGFEFFYALNIIKKINNLSFKNFEKIKVIGGGSFNDHENEIKSNILNLNYIKLNKLPYELLGGFLIAKYGEKLSQGYKNLVEENIIKFEKEYIPLNEKVKYYEGYRDKYGIVIEKMKELYYEINKSTN